MMYKYMMSKKITKFFCISLILFHFFTLLKFQTTHAQNLALPATCLQILQNPYNNFYIHDTLQPQNQKFHSQSIAHLEHPSLKNSLINNYRIQQKIQSIGKEKVEKLINEILKKELEYQENNAVFYHGQKLEFLLLQNLFEEMYKIIFKKNLIDFIMLRIPNTFSKQYRTVEQFLKQRNYNIYDGRNPDRSLLLSVNFALFGNSTSTSSSSFYYFLTSGNLHRLDILNIIKKLFDYFHLTKLYNKYKKKLQNLNQILSRNDKEKTGLLIQIFIPKKKVNQLAYKSYGGGTPYYNPQYSNLSSKHSVSKELDDLKKVPFILRQAKYNIDSIQFRILLNEEIMLNPNNNEIKLIRYFNSDCKIIKKYKLMLKKLINELKKDITNDV